MGLMSPMSKVSPHGAELDIGHWTTDIGLKLWLNIKKALS